jgi:SAM-dependent methyltransferase
MQRILSGDQVEAFYHDKFVEDQTRHFISLLGTSGTLSVTDVGGGCGFFAKRLGYLAGHRVRVLDTDEASLEACRKAGVEAARGDALDPSIAGPAEVVAFNLILHHLVGASGRETRELQRRALALWGAHAGAVFVNEYIYESWLGGFSAWLIFQVTRSRLLSWIGRALSALAPSLRANTFGVGVRFRPHGEWLRLFREAGYEVVSAVLGRDEPVSLPRRLLMIRKIRRDSFLLKPRAAAP